MLKAWTEAVTVGGRSSAGFSMLIKNTTKVYSQSYDHQFIAFDDFTQKTKEKAWKQGKTDYKQFIHFLEHPVSSESLLDQLASGKLSVEEFCKLNNKWTNIRRQVFTNMPVLEDFISRNSLAALNLLQNKTLQTALKKDPQIIGTILRSPYAEMFI